MHFTEISKNTNKTNSKKSILIYSLTRAFTDTVNNNQWLMKIQGDQGKGNVFQDKHDPREHLVRRGVMHITLI